MSVHRGRLPPRGQCTGGRGRYPHLVPHAAAFNDHAVGGFF
ncbi:hypothetical protein SDC9_183450 [bioreactor metagenome]|uniref:Uncharacterized protein n=1 Tax=bioreactor metagenome TaxID=1076179 RepID=A0A645HA94_9ZZZZ